ncbi:MAG: hypothetical protein J6I98_02990 [Clostridia bacterium]|nr:hypothetical protein [Clostridia bacterium]
MRRFAAAMIILALVFTMTSCRNNENLSSDSKNALRICIDITYVDSDEEQRYIEDFLFSLRETGGLESVVIEMIPKSGSERETAITRIRTELMAGGGPDVFIVDCPFNTEHIEPVFPFPEKVMEAGLFLPLDEYMENSTEFTEWDKMQSVVLAAGQNEEGQQIIPLSYTFPIQTCQTTDFTLEMPDKLVTWQDTLTDPRLSAVYARFDDCVDVDYGHKMDGSLVLGISYNQYFEHVLGKLADFEEEELLFTEEELLERINEILVLQEDAEYEENSIFKDQFMGSTVVNDSPIPVTMMPMYSDDGGIAVSIRNFAAVNRNTKHPEEAYRVIDVLLRTQQLTKPLYTDGLCRCGDILESVPLNDAAFHKDTPFKLRSFSDESYARFSQVKEQITAANFQSSLSYDLYMLMLECKRENDPVVRETLVHEAYVQMQRKVRE